MPAALLKEQGEKGNKEIEGAAQTAKSLKGKKAKRFTAV